MASERYWKQITKVVDIAHQSGFAPQPALHNALEPKVEHVMEVEVAQKYADGG
jgi:hypothetical protein